MVKMPKRVVDLFNDPKASKVLATLSSDGKLNVVPKGSLMCVDEERIAFADIMGGKTNENLISTGKVAACAFKFPPWGYQVKGTFKGFQTSGELYETFVKQMKPLKVSVKAVAVIEVEEVYSVAPPDPGKRLA